MSVKSMDGSILISKSTLIRLLQVCAPARLTSKSTLFDTGYEEHKKDMAHVLQREFKIDMNLNPAPLLIKELSK